MVHFEFESNGIFGPEISVLGIVESYSWSDDEVGLWKDTINCRFIARVDEFGREDQEKEFGVIRYGFGIIMETIFGILRRGFIGGGIDTGWKMVGLKHDVGKRTSEHEDGLALVDQS